MSCYEENNRFKWQSSRCRTSLKNEGHLHILKYSEWITINTKNYWIQESCWAQWKQKATIVWLCLQEKKTKLQSFDNKKIAETKWYFTPSVLKRIRAAWMNFILPFCIFVLTVSSGWEMNILHAPDKTDQDKISLVKWSTILLFISYYIWIFLIFAKLPATTPATKSQCEAILY